MNQNSFELPINGLLGNWMAIADAQSFAKCFEAYSNVCPGVDISSIGLNNDSATAYIALENGVTIESSFGSDCKYFIADPDTDQEISFREYRTALDALHPMSNPLND